MTPEEWQRIRPILEAALELEAPDRANFLDTACDDEPELRREVESLLASHDDAETGLLETPPASAALAMQEEMRLRLASGQRVGPYEIVGEIAQGGMGAVYRAVRADGQYKQQVALKIVRPEFGGEATAARFRTERQILATLDHPNIARILDGGSTAEGVPYFVMELIDGLPITKYCDQLKLTIDERLTIFRTVCSAVHYAHQRLVIHRDIKPTNILVTAEGVPKLLDFGIAKILDPTAMTETMPMTLGGSLMTPEYASPEQFQGAAITTATDVYSLGLVLYELLTGRRPYRTARRMPHEVARLVLETDPEKPSTATSQDASVTQPGDFATPATPQMISSLRSDSPDKLRKKLSGDLDNIVLKALRKEPAERYTSADQLSEDLRRHREGLPILAKKGSVAYRARKYVLRHKVVVAAAALIFLSLVGGLGLTLREARIAKANQLRAEKRFNDVRALANSLIFEVHDSIRTLAGATPARKLLVSKALQYLDSLSAEASGDASLQAELAEAYERVGDVQGYPDTPNLGEIDGALASYKKALAIREALRTTSGGSLQSQEKVANDNERLGRVLQSLGRYQEALPYLQKDFQTRSIVEKTDPNARAQELLAGAYFLTAMCQNELQDSNAALESYKKSAEIRESIADQFPMARARLAGTYGYMAPILWRKGEHAEAEATQKKALTIVQQLAAANPNDATAREYLDEAYYWTAFYQQEGGKLSPALANYRKALADFEALSAADPKEVRARDYVGLCEKAIGETLLDEGKLGEALQSLQKAVVTLEPRRSANVDDIAKSYYAMGAIYERLAMRAGTREARMSGWQKARDEYRKSLDAWMEVKKRGDLERLGRGEPEKVEKELKKCEAAIGQYGGTS